MTAGRTLLSPLRIKRSFRNVVIRHQSAARLAVRQRKTIKVVGAPVTARLQRRVLLSFVQDVASPRPYLSSLGATVRCFAGIATRRAKGAAAGAEASGIAGGNSYVDLLHDSGQIRSDTGLPRSVQWSVRLLYHGKASLFEAFSLWILRSGPKLRMAANRLQHLTDASFPLKIPETDRKAFLRSKVVHRAHGPIN